MVVQDDDAIERLRHGQVPEAVQRNPNTSNRSINDFKRKLSPKAILIYAFIALKKTPEGRQLLGKFIERNHNSMADFNERVKPQIFAQTLAAVVFHHESYNFFETDEDFKKSENWIIQILALFFERRIELISIIDEEDRQVNQKHHDKCWYIFCIRAGKESVYVSTKVA